MIGIPNDLGLPRPEAPWSGKPLPSNKHPLNVKARELMEQVGAYFRSDQLHVVSLAYWGLEQVLGFGEAELESNDLAHAVRELKIWTEAKEAMKFLLKERNLPDQMYTARELQEMFLETDDPELGAVIILQLIARGAVKETADLVVSEHLQEHDPQEILMLLQNSRQSQEQHLTPLVGSTTRASINSPDVSSELNFKPKQEKVAHYSEDQVKTSDSANDCYNRGLAKYRLGQYEAAIADYDNAIRLKPDYVNVYYSRGLTKYYLGQYEAAIVDYDNAIRLKPAHLNAYYERGLAKYILGQYEAAIDDYDNAIRLKPAHLNAYYSRALAKCNLGQYEAAIVDYDNAIRFEPNDANAYYDRGLAKEKLGQTGEAEQDWQTALKLTTETGNVKLKNKIEGTLRRSEPQVKASESLTEKEVKEIVADYFKALPIASSGYSVKREYLIQMGSDQRRADIVFLRNGKLVAIAECKRTRRVENGHEQLHSYLCATDTYFGIFANDGDPNKWTFWENHRHNNFLEIDRETFENYVYNHDKAIKDREKKIKLEIEREIDAEIRQRVRKNTDTDAVRQNETDRIKREITENIDKTAIVNSVKSQIAQQAENRLLNKRDEENRKRGREQGFWWTIFSLIGIGILIALLITSAA